MFGKELIGEGEFPVLIIFEFGVVEEEETDEAEAEFEDMGTKGVVDEEDDVDDEPVEEGFLTVLNE